MEENPSQEQTHAIPDEGLGEKSVQFKGIRKRKWGRWVSEIRIRRSRKKLWLGSYTTAEQAARAYDAAAYCLRGANAIFNFPDSIPSIPSASSLSRLQVQLAATRYASLNQVPSISPSAHNNNENANAGNSSTATERSASPSRSALVPDSVPLHNSQREQEDDLALWESVFTGSDNCATYNLERLPSIDEAPALNLIPIRSPSPSWKEEKHEEEEENKKNFFESTDLWKFGDV